MRAALYARVSTTDKGQDPELQLRELRELAKRAGWKTTTEFTDQVSSAKVRPQLEELLKLCRHHHFDVIAVYRFDRFARSTIELVTALQEFSTLGIDFVSVHEGIDTRTPQGKLVFTIFAAIAEFERALIRERVRSGMANARAKGKHIGRPRKIVDVAEVAALRAQGKSWRAIAHECDVPDATLRRAIRNERKVRQKVGKNVPPK